VVLAVVPTAAEVSPELTAKHDGGGSDGSNLIPLVPMPHSGRWPHYRWPWLVTTSYMQRTSISLRGKNRKVEVVSVRRGQKPLATCIRPKNKGETRHRGTSQ